MRLLTLQTIGSRSMHNGTCTTLMNIACGIEYDGTDYHGFQRQPAHHGATVQGALETAIERISGERFQWSTEQDVQMPGYMPVDR